MIQEQPPINSPGVVTRMVLAEGATFPHLEWLQEDGTWGKREGRHIFPCIRQAWEEADRRKREGMVVSGVAATVPEYLTFERTRRPADREAMAEASAPETRADWHAGKPNCGVD